MDEQKRIDKLVKEVRGMRWVMLALVCLYLFSRNRPTRVPAVEVTNDDGNVVANLRTNDRGEPSLQMKGDDGQSLTISPAGIYASRDGKQTISIQAGGTAGGQFYGPSFTLYDKAGENRASMYLAGDSAFLIFNHYETVDIGRQYHTNLMMHSTTQTAQIELYDGSNKVVWRAPSPAL